MSAIGLIENTTEAAVIVPLLIEELPGWLAQQSPAIRRWVEVNGFRAEAQTSLRLPDETETLLVGLGETEDRWSFSGLPAALPEGDYRLACDLARDRASRLALGWALGSYRFTRYKAAERGLARLCWPASADRAEVERAALATFLVRDLINTPASDLGPAELADVASKLAREFKADLRVIVGDALLDENYGLVHAVGRASPREPRLIDLTWGDPTAPKLTLVGKGVCFDTGGLNLKGWAGMLYMKLDMGGAAHALGLARMVMQAGLPVRLRVLIPAVENSVAGNAVRPLDVVTARNGLTVEIANTDAEGRLILADALAEASSEKPAMILDFATLTSAAFVALGPDIPAMFANDDALAADLERSSRRTEDPLWRLPLWRDYAANLKGKVADITNVADLNLGFTTLAGAIHAALFMDRFVDRDVPWAHFDIMAWNMRTRPGRPDGGEARGLLAAFDCVAERFGAGA
jgi:leucyl aminopeptidase